jgi:uncharacterized protein YigA (DUF484 family)
MKAEEVAAWLQQHPEFFEHHAETIAAIAIPHPHGGRTISISERQILALREKCKQLEAKLGEIIQFGEENDALGERLHRLTLAVIAARDLPALAHAVHFNLREDFAVPHTALRLWRGAGPAPEFGEASATTRDFAASLVQPYCSARAMVDTAALFGEAAPHLRSFAYVPLRDAECFGVLALASEDAQRFYPEMGTLYLQRLGETVAAAYARQLAAA